MRVNNGQLTDLKYDYIKWSEMYEKDKNITEAYSFFNVAYGKYIRNGREKGMASSFAQNADMGGCRQCQMWIYTGFL